MKVLVIEDEAPIVRALERGFGASGDLVVSADNGEDGIALAMDRTVDFVLLDISLPGRDGHQVLARIRAVRPDVPVLMLTARDDLENKVNALNAGADDYVTKPFAFEELLARMGALSRRAEPSGSTLEAGDLRVNLLSHRAWRGGKEIELSSREFTLLEFLMRNPRQVLSRQQILSAVWDYDFDPGSNVLNVYVRYLRSKIDRLEEPSLISTVRGVGYRFDPPGGSSVAPVFVVVVQVVIPVIVVGVGPPGLWDGADGLGGGGADGGGSVGSSQLDLHDDGSTERVYAD